MGRSVQSGYCEGCHAQRRFEREGPNHVLHLLLAIITAGLWTVPWILLALGRSLDSHRCSVCGETLRANFFSSVGKLLGFVVICAVLATPFMMLKSRLDDHAARKAENAERPSAAVPKTPPRAVSSSGTASPPAHDVFDTAELRHQRLHFPVLFDRRFSEEALRLHQRQGGDSDAFDHELRALSEHFDLTWEDGRRRFDEALAAQAER